MAALKAGWVMVPCVGILWEKLACGSVIHGHVDHDTSHRSSQPLQSSQSMAGLLTMKIVGFRMMIVEDPQPVRPTHAQRMPPLLSLPLRRSHGTPSSTPHLPEDNHQSNLPCPLHVGLSNVSCALLIKQSPPPKGSTHVAELVPL